MSLLDPAARLRRARPPVDPREYPPPARRSDGWDPPGQASLRAEALITRGRLSAVLPRSPAVGGPGLGAASSGGVVGGPYLPLDLSLAQGGPPAVPVPEVGADYAGRLGTGGGPRRLRPPARAAEILLPWALDLAHGLVDAAPEDPARPREVRLVRAGEGLSWREGGPQGGSLRLTSQDWALLTQAVAEGGQGWSVLTGAALRAWALSLLRRVFERDAHRPVDLP